MVSYLLDTCFLSEVLNPRGDLAVQAYFDSLQDDDMYLSVLVIGEIAKGAEKLGPGRRRAGIDSFLGEAENAYADRILHVSLEIARAWGELEGRLTREGHRKPS